MLGIETVALYVWDEPKDPPRAGIALERTLLLWDRGRRSRVKKPRKANRRLRQLKKREAHLEPRT